jgi:hypothetical protein
MAKETHHIDSKALGRTVELVVNTDNPHFMLFDGVQYTRFEMDRLKGLSNADLRTAHDIKRIFDAEIQT